MHIMNTTSINMRRYGNSNDYEKKYSTDEEDSGKLNTNKSTLRKEVWNKKGSMSIGDGAEIRAPIFNTLLKKSTLPIPEDLHNSSSEEDSTKQQWQASSKRFSLDDNENYTPVTNRTLLHTGSRNSKISVKDKTYNDLEENTNSPTLLMRSSLFRQSGTNLLYEKHINYVTLFGFGMGLLVSKLLQYLLIYLNWLLKQVKQLRDVFLGDGNIMDFFNFDDNSRYDLRIKLLIMPILAICCFLYFLVAILHYGIRIILTNVPSFMTAMLQKIVVEI